MRPRLGRILAAAVATEVLAILALVLIVALSGPADDAAAQAMAESLGYWVGPIAGFVFCLLAGYWLARKLDEGHIATGLLLGLMAAGIDVALLLLGGSAFKVIFVVSNLGRVVAGGIGGWLAGRSAAGRELG